MSAFVLTCCSTADMPPSFFEAHKIPYLCFHFTIDGVDYRDDLGQSMPFSAFYQKITDGAQPTTSQVSVGQYVDCFEPILKSGQDILHLTLSSGLSGTYASACIARDTLREKYPQRRIEIVDSLGASSGYGLLVTAACSLRDKGAGLEAARLWLEAHKLRIHHWFFSTDLSSYYRGGRISKTSAVFGTMLHICPLLNMDCNGKLIPRDKYRGVTRVMDEIVARMVEHADGGLNYSGKCYISNSACEEYARTVATMIEKKFKHLDGKVQINSVGTVIGSHTGPGTVALFFFGDERVN
ncbi:MAG: DegV family protein [Ruthenibacterium sp.]